MPTVIRLPLEGSLTQAIQRKEAAQRLEESEEWEAFLFGVAQRKRQLMSEAINGPASENGAHYERILGQIRGLDQVEGILRGVIETGKRAEVELRKHEETPQR